MSCWGLACWALLAVFAIGAPESSSAAAEHVFDPVLSLRGDCSVSSLDQVRDPGVCPGTPGIDHPERAFTEPCGTAVDRLGNIYVASAGQNESESEGAPTGTGGRIDVFSPSGVFLTEFKDKNKPCDLAVDSAGNVFVMEFEGRATVRFAPAVFPPAKGTKYTLQNVVHALDTTNGSTEACTQTWSVAVDPSNDHVYVGLGCSIAEYDSAANGSGLIDETIGVSSGKLGLKNVDVYGGNHDVYTTASGPGGAGRFLVLDGADGHTKCEIDGSETPDGSFGFVTGLAGVAVDQETGDAYVADVQKPGHSVVDQFDADCHYLGQLEHSFTPFPPNIGGAEPAVDAPCLDASAQSCNPGPGHEYGSPNRSYVYVAQGSSAAGYHLYAFKPRIVGPPEIQGQAASGVSETEAVLFAELNPGGLQTHYRFEYTTEEYFAINGYANAPAVPVPDAEADSGGSFAAVSEPISGLIPGTVYRFRLVASNCEDPEALAGECLTEGEGNPGGAGSDATFSTYPSDAGLADGRGYELVTPPDTGGHIPMMSELGTGFNTGNFNSSLVSPDGRSLAFGIEGGSLPALGGGGYHDTYEAVREPNGWVSRFTGLSGEQAQIVHPGGIALDHGYSFWQTDGSIGTLAVNGLTGAGYLRRSTGVVDAKCSPEPGGLFEFIGCGSLGNEPFALGEWISPAGGHIIFVAGKSAAGVEGRRLEPCAAPQGTQSIYDRTLDGVTHCVSLLPGEISPKAGEEATYLGASEDGSAVAFEVADTLYARLDDAETVEVAPGDSRFAGLSQGGNRLVYLRPNTTEPLLAGTQIPQGEIFACEVRLGPCDGAGAQSPIQIGSGEESVLVNVSGDGSHVYFTSPKQLDVEGDGQVGKDNLYVWSDGSIRLVGVLDRLDVEGRSGVAGGSRVGGLGLWLTHVAAPSPERSRGAASDPSRATPDGSVLVFESRNDLTTDQSEGKSEIYRYDADLPAGQGLVCVSCNPTGLPAVSDAQLQTDFGEQLAPFPPVNSMTPVANVTGGGDRVFFQSADRLSAADNDGKVDVYEWEATGIGGCGRAGGCIHLISGGHSAGNDYLYAVGSSGEDVFFLSGDLLVPEDRDATPSIYDARVGGGFPPPAVPPVECQGEACQPVVTPPGEPASTVGGAGPSSKSPGKQKCKTSKRTMPRSNKARCPGKKHHKQPKHHRGHGNRGSSR
jgi:hypothetical protein